MPDVTTKLILDADDAGVSQALKTADADLRQVGDAATAAGRRGARAAQEMESSWKKMNQEVKLSGGLFKAQFSAEQIGSALNAISGDVGKLAGSIAGLDAQSQAFTSSMTTATVSLATGNPFAALAASSQSLVSNLTAVVNEWKNLNQLESQLGTKKSSLWNTMFGEQEIKTAAADRGAIKRAVAEKQAVRLQAAQEAAAKESALAQAAADKQSAIDKAAADRAATDAARAAQTEANVSERLQQQLAKLTMSEADYAIQSAQRELETFQGTADQRLILEQITAKKIADIRAKQSDDAAAAQATAARDAADAQQRADQELLRNRQDQHKQMLAMAEERLAKAQAEEAGAKTKAMLSPRELARQDRETKKSQRKTALEEDRLERLVASAQERSARGGPLSRRQQAALEFANARAERGAAEAAVKNQADNVRQIKDDLAALTKITAALFGVAGGEQVGGA